MAEKATCDLNCPRCKKLWGRLTFEYDSFVKPSDVKVVAGKRKKFKDGDELKCTLCGHSYNNYDVYLAIHESGVARG